MVGELHGAPILNAMRDSTLLVQRRALQNAPVDTGRLRASITPEVHGGAEVITGVVGSNVVYAPYMEYGTRPHWPPPGALEVWSRRHGMEEFLVMRAIARRGLAPRYYFRQAFEQSQGYIANRFDQAVEVIIR